MDEMKIVSKFTTGIISRMLKAYLKKKFGYDIDIQLNEFKAVVANGRSTVHLDIDACMGADEMDKFLKSVGLE